MLHFFVESVLLRNIYLVITQIIQGFKQIKLSAFPLKPSENHDSLDKIKEYDKG